MKIIIGLLALISLDLNAQQMNDPEKIITAFFIATDQREWEQVASFFDDEVLLDYSSMNGAPASTLTPNQIISAWKEILPGFDYTHHQIGNMTSSTIEDRAEVFCYGTASHYLNNEGDNVWLVVGTYDFELRKQEDGTWKIRSMKFNFKYQDGNISLPAEAINRLK